jgi:hypothetical protein
MCMRYAGLPSYLREEGSDCVGVQTCSYSVRACVCVCEGGAAVVTACEPNHCADGIRKASLRCRLPITAGGLKLRAVAINHA